MHRGNPPRRVFLANAAYSGGHWKSSASRRLETGDYHVGRSWKQEFYATLPVGLDCGRRVERGERDALCTITVLPVDAADVDEAVRDGIVGDLLAMTVAIDEYCGRLFLRD